MKIDPVPAAIWALGFVTTALVLYYTRCQSKKLYGIIEIMIGPAATFFAARSLPDPIKRLSHWETPDASTVLQTLAGVYIIIRGLDNIEKGFEKAQQLPLWLNLFHKPFRMLPRPPPKLMADDRSASDEP